MENVNGIRPGTGMMGMSSFPRGGSPPQCLAVMWEACEGNSHHLRIRGYGKRLLFSRQRKTGGPTRSQLVLGKEAASR